MVARSIVGYFAHRNVRRTGECAALLQWLAPRTGERVLDVGCGDGYQTMRIAKAGAEVVGIDINRRQLRKAGGLYRHRRSECLYMNAEQMDFPPASFDKVVSFCVIEHFSRNEAVLQHIGRVLKPGGLLVFSADSLSAPGTTETERRRHRRRYGVETLFDEALVRDKLERHGFELIETRYILTTPLAVALCRLSWKLERIGRPWAPLIGLGNLLLGSVGTLALPLSERRAGCRDGGQTLLVRARRRPAV